MGYPPDRGRLSTRYSPVRHFTRAANRAFSCDLHVLGMPPALILSQDQTLQFYLEFSRTRTHYLVFKEQVLVINIVATSAPLSRDLFFALRLRPLSGNCFCNPTHLPCQPLGADFFLPRRANPAAFQATVIYIQSPQPCQAPVQFLSATQGRRFHNFPSLPDLVRAGCPPSVSDPNQWPGNLRPPASMLNQ
jgi:hypothetical protein